MTHSSMSTFLPTVKCSMCARDIEISMMGDHVCGAASAEPTQPLREPYGRFDQPYQQMPTNRTQMLKPGKLPPPMVDTFAANRPFFRQDQLTPISDSSESRSVSPRTPNDGRRSPYGRPRDFIRPPSPEILSSNLDSAFPPFPAPKPQAKGGSRLKKDTPAAADPAANARHGGGAHPVLQRMGSIAPGPFDLHGRPGGRRPHTPEPDAPRNDAPPRQVRSPEDARSITSSGDERGGTSGARIPRGERTAGYEGFGPPGAEQQEQRPLQAENRSQTLPAAPYGRPPPEQRFLQAENRSNTFPLSQPSRPPVGLPRRPSEPNTPPRKPSNMGSTSISPPRQRRPSGSAADAARPPPSQPPPPRGGNLLQQREGKAGGAPDLAAEFGTKNPYHTPSASESSTSSVSSRLGPEPGARRKPSSPPKIETAMQGVQSTAAPTPPAERLVKPMAPFAGALLSPESPMDPAIQGGRLLSPIAPRSTAAAEPRRRPTTGKGNCKGCGEGIKGKSVSSADGRLTGRYHKQCFVCKTCSQPFATATFYVIDDAPYCERHYHKLNGSLCHSCDKGIEGQYLETERKQKHHPTCLTCTDCRKVLRDDYFEMNGKVYCERDAYRKAQQRNFLGTNRMERRTTRLMMM